MVCIYNLCLCVCIYIYKMSVNVCVYMHTHAYLCAFSFTRVELFKGKSACSAAAPFSEHVEQSWQTSAGRRGHVLWQGR